MWLIECRARVAGTPGAMASLPAWNPDPDALLRVVRAWSQRCVALPATVGTLQLSPSLEMEVALDDSLDAMVRQIMLEKLQNLSRFELRVCGGGRWRILQVNAYMGAVGIFEMADDLLDESGWRPVLGQMRELIIGAHHDLAYALVKHGSNVLAATLGYSLGQDWPPRDGFTAPWYLEGPFEYAYAPDAFALQLLGPGYPAHTPAGDDWVRTELTPGFTLVEHRRVEEWFGHPFMPFGGDSLMRVPHDPPRVLVQARDDFAAVLYDDSVRAARKAELRG